MKKMILLFLLIGGCLSEEDAARAGRETLQKGPLKVEFASPREGGRVHGAITVEAVVNHPGKVDYVDFYIQEPGAEDRYSWKEYAPPFMWGGHGQKLDTTMFNDGLASAVVFCHPKDKGAPVVEKRIRFVIDNQKPTVRVVSPKDRSHIGRMLKVEAEVRSPKASPGGIARVLVYVDGEVRTKMSGPPYQATMNTCLMTRGPHALKVVAVDRDGLTSSETVMVVVGDG